LKPVLAPAGEFLSFASPKERNQRKGDPDAACFLRSSVFTGVAGRDFLSLRQRAASLPHPFGLFPPKLPVLGAAYGRWGIIVGWGELVNPNKYNHRCHVGVRSSPQPTALRE